MKSIFLIGWGYIAQHFIDRCSSDFSAINIASRNRPNNFSGWQKIDEDFNIAEAITHIMITIPPHEAEQILCDHVMKCLPKIKNLQWVGYLSATSVYGDYDGEWVNEESQTRTKTISGEQRLKSEEMWRKAFGDDVLNIFRLAGIYGEGRSTIERINEGKVANIKKEGHFFSRIYIDDLVEILRRSALQNDKGEIYNVADDKPSELHEVIEYCGKMMGMDIPVAKNIHDPEVSDRMREFFLENKKIDNTKVKNRLNYMLQYPSYKEGLAAIWKKYRDR